MSITLKYPATEFSVLFPRSKAQASGLLIQTTSGNDGGTGSLFTIRSGRGLPESQCAAQAELGAGEAEQSVAGLFAEEEEYHPGLSGDPGPLHPIPDLLCLLRHGIMKERHLHLQPL